MRVLYCIRETEAARAARAGTVPPDVQDHLLGCVTCRETFAVASSLRSFAISDPSRPLAPAPGRIWWKAEIAKERAAAREAMTAVRAVEIAGPTIAACLLGGWIAWHWTEIGSALSSWTRGMSVAGPVSLPAALVTLAAAAVTLTVAAVALRPFLTHDEG